MRKTDIRRLLTNKGYKITTCMNGGFIATKNQSKYKADSLNKLYNKIVKEL